MLRLVVFCLILVLSSQAQNNSNSHKNELGPDASRVVTKAAQWLLEQRGPDFTWGSFTPRAVVALALAEEVFPLPKEEWNLMTKQINILLSLELGKKSGAQGLGLSPLALYINALYATCQDPRHFHGLDLVQELRTLTTAAQTIGNFSLPAVFLPLCLAGEGMHQDLVQLAHMYRAHEGRGDLRALELLAIGCLTRESGFKSFETSFRSYLDSFTRWFPVVSGIADVYTKALGFQAMNIYDRVIDPSSLVLHQEDSGSFGSLLATYYAIPALLRKSVLDLKNRRCGDEPLIGRFADSAFSPVAAPKVYFSIWIGEGDDRDSHTITISDIANKTFYDIMEVAQSRNPIFKFSCDETSSGKRVYSLAGLPNDVEREIYWTLYMSKGSPDPRRLHSKHLVTTGIERVYPTAEEHYVFWFRRKPQH